MSPLGIQGGRICPPKEDRYVPPTTPVTTPRTSPKRSSLETGQIPDPWGSGISSTAYSEATTAESKEDIFVPLDEGGSVDPFESVDFDQLLTFQERELAEATARANERRDALKGKGTQPDMETLRAFFGESAAEPTPETTKPFDGFDPFA